MPDNFLEINRYFALTSYCNTIGQSNNALSILVFSLAGKRSCYILNFSSIGWQKKITNTDRNHFASSYENRSNRLNHNKHILAANLLIHLFEYESESCDHGFRSDVRVLTRHEPSCELSFQCQLNSCHLSCQISVQFMYHFTWRKQDPSSRKILWGEQL